MPVLPALVPRLPGEVIVLPVSYFRDPKGNSYPPSGKGAELAARRKSVFGACCFFVVSKLFNNLRTADREQESTFQTKIV
jgi:hypothetical protein